MSRLDILIILCIFACAAGLLLVLTPISLIFRVVRFRSGSPRITEA
jgi:hypothetical protein